MNALPTQPGPNFQISQQPVSRQISTAEYAKHPWTRIIRANYGQRRGVLWGRGWTARRTAAAAAVEWPLHAAAKFKQPGISISNSNQFVFKAKRSDNNTCGACREPRYNTGYRLSFSQRRVVCPLRAPQSHNTYTHTHTWHMHNRQTRKIIRLPAPPQSERDSCNSRRYN